MGQSDGTTTTIMVMKMKRMLLDIDTIWDIRQNRTKI